MKNFLALVVACLLHSIAFAQAVPSTISPPRVAFPITQVGNVSTIGAASAVASNAANFSFGVAANGSVYANTGASLPTAGGSSIPLGVNGAISAANVVGAVGRFMGKVLPVLSTGAALYDLAKELGYTTTDGKNITKDAVSSSSIYFQYANNPDYLKPSPEQSCTYAAITIYGGTGVGTVYGTYPSSLVCEIYTGGNWRATQSLTPVTTTTDTPAKSATQQDLLDSIALRTNWPTTSALARTVVDAIKAGDALDVAPQSITGPASAPVSQPVVVKDYVNNTTTTTTTTANYTYGPNTVTNNQTSTTTTVNNSTGAVTTNTTTTSSPDAKPSNPCDQNPTSVGCQSLGDAPSAEKIPSLDQAVTYTPTIFAAPTGCPAAYTGQIKVLTFVKEWAFTFTPMCDLMETLRPLFLALGAAAAAFIFMEALKPS